MTHAAGDLRNLIDISDNQPGSVLQRREGWFGDVWRDYMVDGKAVIAPITSFQTFLERIYSQRKKTICSLDSKNSFQ